MTISEICCYFLIPSTKNRMVVWRLSGRGRFTWYHSSRISSAGSWVSQPWPRRFAKSVYVHPRNELKVLDEFYMYNPHIAHT